MFHFASYSKCAISTQTEHKLAKRLQSCLKVDSEAYSEHDPVLCIEGDLLQVYFLEFPQLCAWCDCLLQGAHDEAGQRPYHPAQYTLYLVTLHGENEARMSSIFERTALREQVPLI